MKALLLGLLGLFGKRREGKIKHCDISTRIRHVYQETNELEQNIKIEELGLSIHMPLYSA
jgi:hypothetical protein